MRRASNHDDIMITRMLDHFEIANSQSFPNSNNSSWIFSDIPSAHINYAHTISFQLRSRNPSSRILVSPNRSRASRRMTASIVALSR